VSAIPTALVVIFRAPPGPADGRGSLTLKTPGGLTTGGSRAFLVPEPTMAQRLVRASAKIRQAAILPGPPAELLPERLPGVLAVLYLVFNEATPRRGPWFGRTWATRRSVWPARRDADARRARDRGPAGADAPSIRAATRTDPRGRRSCSRIKIAVGGTTRCRRGSRHLGRGPPRSPAGPYQLQGAIAALHARCPGPGHRLAAIAALYDRLAALAAPVVGLNRASRSRWRRSRARSALFAPLEGDLEDYHLFHAARADLSAGSTR
jgi:RNA polymerase sigma-70 factor (ECF subfamily)